MIEKIIIGLIFVILITGCSPNQPSELTCEQRGGTIVVLDGPDGLCPEGTVDIGMTEILDCFCKCCK